MAEFSLMQWLIVAIVVFIIISYVQSLLPGKDVVCKACGVIGEAKRATRGSFGIELILWLCFIVPGLIYSLWRGTTAYKVCKKCGSSDVIPIDSPIGQRIISENAAPRMQDGSMRCEKCGGVHGIAVPACPQCGYRRQA